MALTETPTMLDRSTPWALGLALAALLVLAPTPRPAPAANAEWKNLAGEFKKNFKPGKTSLKQREELVKTLARAEDGRAVALLVDAMRDQAKFAAKQFEEWSLAQDEWQEKTTRLERQREERMRKIIEKAKKKGEKPTMSVDLNSEEGRWLGAPPEHPGEMEKARKQLMDRYDGVVAERGLWDAMRQGIVRVMRDVQGEEFEGAASDLLKAAERTKDEERMGMIKTLGYIRGEGVTRFLVGETKASDPAHAQAALASLGRQNTEEGKQLLLAFLAHEEWQLRSAALDGLVFYRDVEVMDALLAQAAKEEGVVQRRIFQTMESMCGERVKAVLEAWISWWPTNKDDVVASWKRVPREGPVQDDPPKFPLQTESNDDSTSFYGIKTNSKHIIFVADISGSMGPQEDDPKGEPTKIDTCREELKRAIRGLSATDEDERGGATFNVVLFSTDVLVYKPGKMVAATKKNKERVFEWIDEKVHPDMQTNIFGGIEQAFNVISDSSDKKNRERGADTIFLMTDGSPTRGKFVRPEVILKEVRRLNEVRDITIHTIGVGKNHIAGFLQRLATENGGQYLAR